MKQTTLLVDLKTSFLYEQTPFSEQLKPGPIKYMLNTILACLIMVVTLGRVTIFYVAPVTKIHIWNSIQLFKKIELYM